MYAMMPELLGNKAIENAAIAWMMGLERAAGRAPQDTRYRGAPADIESPPQLFEVKAFGRSNRGGRRVSGPAESNPRVSLPDDAVTRRPGIPLALLAANPAALDTLKAALEWFCETVRAYSF